MNPTHNLVPDEWTVPGVLRAAARYISVYGWHQGDMFAEDGGTHPPACSIGAIRYVTAGTAAPLTAECCVDVDECYPVYANAVDALCGYLLGTGAIGLTDELVEPFDVVAEWNDDPDRNVSQVLAALTTVAQQRDRSNPGGVR